MGIKVVWLTSLGANCEVEQEYANMDASGNSKFKVFLGGIAVCDYG